MLVETLPKVLQQARTADGVGLQLRWEPEGLLEVPELENVLVCLHAGAPAKLVCWRGDKRYVGTSVHGDIDIIPARTPMRWEMHDGNDTTLVLSLPDTLLQRVVSDFELDANRVEVWNRFQIRDWELETLGWSVKREMELGCPSGRAYLDGLTLAMASRVVARHSSVADSRSRNNGCAFAKSGNGGLDGRRLKRVLSFVEDQLSEELSLGQIAAVAGISPSHLKTAFRTSVGMPVHQYVMQRRVERAKLLLLKDGMSMAEVAAAAGFAHQSHMARYMRRAMGMPPRAVKKILLSHQPE